MKDKKKAVGLALQIAYEYEDWGDEHIADMLRTYEHPDKPPCNYDELQDLTNDAARYKEQGMTWDQAEIELHKRRKKNGYYKAES